MSKALIVLAECVDIRSGVRFQTGDKFDPAPTVSQAARLIAAGCLPEAAIDFAVQDPNPAEKLAADQKTSQLQLAEQEIADAEIELSAANDLAKTASSDADKKEAAATVSSAQERVKRAKSAIAKLTK